MARGKKEESKKLFEIRVTENPDCCEIGAGGVHFAHGKAELEDCQLLNWYREHEGYEVVEKVIEEAIPADEEAAETETAKK